jgi:peroxiredoxin
MMRQLLPSVLFATTLVLAGCGTRKAEAPSGIDPAVTAMLKANQLEGRVVLVEFGTIGCALSGSGLDSMAEWRRRDAIPGLAYLRLEPTADQRTFNNYYATRSLGFPVVRDTGMTVATAIGTTVFPRFALLDKFGRVRYRGNQPSEKDLAAWAGRLNAEQSDAGPKAPQFGEVALDVPALLAQTKLPALGGKTKSLRDYRGKNGLLLLFVDTNCPFSAAAARQMPAVAAALAQRGVPTVLVNISDADARVRSFYAAGIEGATVVYDTGKATQDRWNMQFVPTAVLVDADGNLVYRGSPVWEHVAEKVAAAANVPVESLRIDAKGTSGG